MPPSVKYHNSIKHKKWRDYQKNNYKPLKKSVYYLSKKLGVDLSSLNCSNDYERLRVLSIMNNELKIERLQNKK